MGGKTEKINQGELEMGRANGARQVVCHAAMRNNLASAT